MVRHQSLLIKQGAEITKFWVLNFRGDVRGGLEMKSNQIKSQTLYKVGNIYSL